MVKITKNFYEDMTIFRIHFQILVPCNVKRSWGNNRLDKQTLDKQMTMIYSCYTYYIVSDGAYNNTRLRKKSLKGTTQIVHVSSVALLY